MADETTSRRSLLRGVALATVAAAAGFVVARTSGLANAKAATTGANNYGPTPSNGRNLGPVSEVPQNGGIVLAADKVVLVREPDGALRAFSAVCTHQGCIVASVQHGIIQCPCHGSQYSAETGAVVHGPATLPLAPVPIAVQDNYVYTRA